jgi:type IV fimbrial biogenesis protein FimT
MNTNRNHLYSARGFTLVELMTSLTVSAILITAAVPTFSEFVADQQIKSNTYRLLADLSLARSEAVKRQMNIELRASGGDWSKGWDVAFIDPNDADILVRSYQAPGSVDVQHLAGLASITFGKDGRVSDAADFKLWDGESGDLGTERRIVFNPSGRPRIERVPSE